MSWERKGGNESCMIPEFFLDESPPVLFLLELFLTDATQCVCVCVCDCLDVIYVYLPVYIY